MTQSERCRLIWRGFTAHRADEDYRSGALRPWAGRRLPGSNARARARRHDVWPAVNGPGQEIGEVVLRVHSVELAGFDQGRDRLGRRCLTIYVARANRESRGLSKLLSNAAPSPLPAVDGVA